MKNVAESTKPLRIIELAVAGAVLAFAYLLTTAAGNRGFFPFDQSIVFDGSYRIVAGQVPYKDFFIPFGPVTFWLQAFFFKLLGVNYGAYVGGAAVVNVAATLIAMLTVRTLFPRLRFLPLVAGILTAVWFYPPFGTPWMDQTAFFFSLLGIGVLTRALVSGRPGLIRGFLVVLAGVLAVLAFLSKQNAGIFMIFVYPVAVVVASWGGPRRIARDLGSLALGMAGAGLAFTIWLVAASDAGTFLHYAFGIASALGRERLSGFERSGLGVFMPFMDREGVLIPLTMLGALLGALAVAIGAVISWAAGKKASPVSRRNLLAAVICIYLVGFEQVFIKTTYNQAENGLAFAGLILSLGAGLLLSLTRLGRARVRFLAAAGLGILLFFTSVAGYRVAMNRAVHEMFRGATFGPPLAFDGLKGLRWARPTNIRGYDVSAEQVVMLCRYLKDTHRNFFIFPDFTLVYGLVGRPSPQPVVWFHEGVTYSRENNADLDGEIVASLRRNHVEVYVWEQAAWFPPGERLDDFPALEEFLRSEFVKVGEIGLFVVYAKR